MTTLLLVLAVTVAVVFVRWTVRQTRLFAPAGHVVHDHEMERQLADLRAMRAYREDPPLFG